MVIKESSIELKLFCCASEYFRIEEREKERVGIGRNAVFLVMWVC